MFVKVWGEFLRSKHKRPLVIDIVDKHDIFQRQFNKRKSYYNKKKYKIQKYDNLTKYINDEFVIHAAKKEQTETTMLHQCSGQCLLNIYTHHILDYVF